MTVTLRTYQDTKERGEWNEAVNHPSIQNFPGIISFNSFHNFRRRV